MNKRLVAVIAALVLAAPLTVGAAAGPVPAAGAFCTLLPWLCPADEDPAPSPSASTPPDGSSDDGSAEEPTETSVPEDPSQPSSPEAPSSPEESPAPDETPTETPAPEESAAPVEAPVDDNAPVFTGTPASMGSGGLSFTGLLGIAIVSVPTADGGSIRALRITADSVTITDFSLTVRPPDGPGLVTTADEMSLKGHVTVYIGSITATTQGGEPITIGTDTPPPLTDIEPGLLNVTMGLVGSLADEITYSNTDQHIVEAE